MALHTNVLSLCAGYGGIDLGLRIALPSARTVCFVEREATVCAVLATRFEDGTLDEAPIWSDLSTFDGKPWRGVVDFLTAGYPCQPFSVAGKRQGRKDPRHLWPHVARIIREVEPEWVFLENVAGHLNLGFRQVAAALRRMGYRVAAGLFTAEEIGAPHRRQRLFALAHRNDGKHDQRQGEISAAHFRDTARRSIVWPGRRNKELANSTSGGRRELRESSASERFTDRRRTAVADPGDGFLSLTRRGSQERDGTGSAVTLLADTDVERLQVSRGSNQRIAQGPYEMPSRNGPRGLSVFPPGPENLRAWRELLDSYPQIEPAICGASNGLTPRVDRLRALGNGVVPLVAAHAYRTLRNAFEN